MRITSPYRLPRLSAAALAAVAVGASVLSSGCAPDDHPDAVAAETSSPIIGGTTVSLATQRSLGLVTIGPLGCSGALISKDWALTATHCIITFSAPSSTTVKAPKADGTTETRTAIALEQVGATDMTLIQLGTTTSTTWPNVTNTMWPSSPANVVMSCYGLGASAYKQPSGTTGGGTWRTATMGGPASNGEIIAQNPTGSPAAAPGDSGGPCFIGGQIAAVTTSVDVDCADDTTPDTCKSTITKIKASHFRATTDFVKYIDRAPLRLQTATFRQLGNFADGGVVFDLLNLWVSRPGGTNVAGISVVQNVAHLRGAAATLGTNPVPFKVGPVSAAIYVPITLCNATKGRLFIQTDGTVNVQQESGSIAQCITSLDGATFALDGSTTTPLQPINGWFNGPFGTRAAAARVVNGVVQFQGAIGGGTSSTPFQPLPASLRPGGRTVYVPVDLCDAKKGRLIIDNAGNVTISTFGSFGDAQCFTSLEGVSYRIDDGGATPLPLASGWTFVTGFSTSSPSARNAEGIVRFAGTMRATGTSDLAFTLPQTMWPATAVYLPIDLCNAQKGQLLILKDGTAHVQIPPGASWSATAQCFVSLEGASYGL